MRRRSENACASGISGSHTLLLAIFAGAALALAALGLYAVMAATVRQRMHELGVRVALGATPPILRRDVLREAIVVALAGVGVGLAGALGIARLVESLVFEVSPWDPATLLAVACLLFAVSLVAAYGPARRAARVDPVAVLRME